MPDAAFLGTFSDFKLIKSRSVAVFCIEVPIEDAGKALETLGGLPLPGGERWVGIAPVDPAAASSNGRTPDFDSGNAGSTPAAATNETAPTPPRGREEEAVHRAAPAASFSEPKRAWREMPLPQRAAILTQDEMFWRYQAECWGGVGIKDAAASDRWLKDYLLIESKRDLLADHDAADKYLMLERMYLDYKNRGEAFREEGY